MINRGFRFMTMNLKNVRLFSKEPLNDRAKALEKEYITKEETAQLKKLHKKLIKEGYNVDSSDDDVDVDILLEDRDKIKQILVEHEIINNEDLIKRLLKWKYKNN